MQMDEGDARLLQPVTERIIGCALVDALNDMHLPQCRNYLPATGKSLCLLINFGQPGVEIRRITPSLAKA